MSDQPTNPADLMTALTAMVEATKNFNRGLTEARRLADAAIAGETIAAPGCKRCADRLNAKADTLLAQLKAQSSFYSQYEDQGRTGERIETLRWAARLLLEGETITR